MNNQAVEQDQVLIALSKSFTFRDYRQFRAT